MKFDILGVSETRRTGLLHNGREDYLFINSAGDHHKQGILVKINQRKILVDSGQTNNEYYDSKLRQNLLTKQYCRHSLQQ